MRSKKLSANKRWKGWCITEGFSVFTSQFTDFDEFFGWGYGPINSVAV